MTDIATLGISVDSSDLKDGTVALDRLGDQAATTGRQVQQSSRQMTRGFSASATAVRGMDRGFVGGAHSSRMLAMQLSQVAQQAQAGGGVLRALAIQLPDIGMAFGTIGIAAGVAAGVLLPLASNLFDTADAGRDFEDVMGDLHDTIAGLESAQDLLRMSLSELRAEYGDAAQAVREMALAQAELHAGELQYQLRQQIRALSEVSSEYRQMEATALQSGTMLRQAIGNIMRDFGIEVTAQAREVADAFRELEQAATFDEQQAILERIVDLFDRLGVEASDIPPEIRAALIQMIEFSNESERAQQLANALASVDVSSNIRTGADEAARLANNLAAARRSAMSGFDIAGEIILDPRDPRYDPVAAAFDEFSRVPTTRPQADRTPRVTGGGSVAAIREITAAHQMAASAIAEAERAAVTYADVQAELNAMLAAGDIDATSYAAALEIAREHLESATDATSLWASEQRRLQDGILDAIEGGESLSDVFRDVARSIARAAAEAALFNSGPLAGMFSGGSMNFGGFFGGLFGGFRANGGPVSSGQAYVVGERGPELFVPNQGGQIVPNGAVQSGSNAVNVTVNYSFQGGITEADLGRALPVLVERTKREVVDAVQRGGAVARVLR